VPLKLVLCDPDPQVIAGWRAEFQIHKQVEVREASILEAEGDAAVNPGNSFGFMDSGLALRFSERFGFAFEDAVRAAVRTKYAGEILVGQAEVFPTGGRPPYLVYAPAMRTPQPVKSSVNAYLAARAALLAVLAHNRAAGGGAIETLLVPGLCTGEGGMHPRISARQIRYAYEEVLGLRELADHNLSRMARREKKLRSMPLAAEEDERD
jgi:O-acetyl-ADP-ribose deacetylase (regulator of RNase III)